MSSGCCHGRPGSRLARATHCVEDGAETRRLPCLPSDACSGRVACSLDCEAQSMAASCLFDDLLDTDRPCQWHTESAQACITRCTDVGNLLKTFVLHVMLLMLRIVMDVRLFSCPRAPEMGWPLSPDCLALLACECCNEYFKASGQTVSE